MNYRHAYHAGNFADVFKHAILTRILVYLTKKPAPLRYIDTHSGIGLYDLEQTEARKTGEWRGGIGKLALVPPGPARDLLQPWLDCLGDLDADGCPARFPGSPILARCLLRPQDSLRLCELHREDADLLDIHIGRDPRVKILQQDGYAGLNALVPPPERRGLVLVDPPFEAPGEFERMHKALLRAHGKWREGVYALWYPVKEAAADRFGTAVAQAGIRRVLRLHIDIGAAAETPGALHSCGLLLVNPPFGLEAEARLLLPVVTKAMARNGRANWSVEWLAGE